MAIEEKEGARRELKSGRISEPRRAGTKEREREGEKEILPVPRPHATTHVAEAVEPPILFILNERFKARRKVNPSA